MPELPEVEIVRRGLEQRLRGRVPRALVIRERRLRWPIPEGLESTVAGSPVEAVDRRGKYLLLAFAHGTLIAHLGMSGSWRWTACDDAPDLHDHVDMVFDDGILRYHDPRRFGALLWHPAVEGPVGMHPLLASLGVEPLSPQFDASLLHRDSRGRNVSIKQFLLAGHSVVGVGNIYASEALFLAGIRPTTRADRLSRARADRLHAAIREVLGRAVERGGSTLRNFSNAAGESGHFQAEASVYGRAGQPCLRCATPLRQIRQGQRSTFFCPVCQRA